MGGGEASVAETLMENTSPLFTLARIGRIQHLAAAQLLQSSGDTKIFFGGFIARELVLLINLAIVVYLMINLRKRMLRQIRWNLLRRGCDCWYKQR